MRADEGNRDAVERHLSRYATEPIGVPMHGNFRYLIEGFCKLCGVDDPHRVIRGGAVMINEVAFWLIHEEKDYPGLVIINCDFGEVMPGRRNDAYRVLLEANLLLNTGSGPAFTLARDTGRVILADRYRLDDKCRPQELYDMLCHLAAKAKAWRTDHFLEKALPGVVQASHRRRSDFNR
jgi:hypothetical protein